MPKAAGGGKPRKRAPRKRTAATAGLEARECRAETGPELAPLASRVEDSGGVVLAAYRDPLGGHPMLLAALPIDRVQPTPFQRDLSETHHKRLAEVIDRTGRFLDPIVTVPAPDGGFWTPNGYHRLEAMRRLGARSITALVLPEREIARQILALNTERAHNLKERALEVARIYRGLMDEQGAQPESSFAFYLEDPSLVTLGMAFEQKRDFAAGAYHPVLRRLEAFSDEPVRTAAKAHEKRAGLVLDLEERVAEVVARLKERGFQSPYLRPFVVARINPLRFIKGELPAAEDVLRTMRDRAARFNVERVTQQDLARAGGAYEEVA